MSSIAKCRELDMHQDQENPLVDDDNEFRLLPELLKMILTKAVLLKMYSKDTAKRQSDESIFSNLASVEFLWWSLMKTYNLRNKIRQFSKVYLQRAKMRSTIIRNNRNFLKEVINPDEIVFPLESSGCLTEDQVTFLRRLRNRKDKNHELLLMLQDFSSQKYSKAIDCLFATNQTQAALVLERGGEVVKLHNSNGKEMRAKEFEMQLIKRFERMQKEDALTLHDLLKASVDKRLNDVFIVHAKQNKGIELWLWCKTETSLKQLKSLSDDDFREIIQRMYHQLIPEHSTSLQPQLIQRDSTSAGDFAERRLSVRHAKIRHICIGPGECVTSLADKIYVAQGNEILVFQNKNPFQSLKSIDFFETVFPISIASCRLNKCLYISARVKTSSSASRCVYKVEPEFDNRMSIWQNDNRLYPISVTSRGDVLDFQIRREGTVLRLFTPEGTVKRTIAIEHGLGQANYIQEIMPDIVALNFSKPSEFGLSCIAIMRLDENGTILRRIECKQSIVGFSSLLYGDLLIGVSENIGAAKRNSIIQIYNSDLVQSESENVEKGSKVLQQEALESSVARNLFTTDAKMHAIHFAADQRQVYVVHIDRLDIYQLNYQDEDYDA